MFRYTTITALALGIAVRGGAQPAAPKAIPNEPTCQRCTITMRTLVTLGTDDGVGSLIGRPMSVNVDARGRYWVFQELEPPTVFSATGAVVRRLGRKGSGPGEYRSANSGIVIGDSMLVLDWQELRATMVGADLKPTRTIRLRYGIGDILMLNWPRTLITVGYMTDSDPPNSSMHVVSMADSQARRVRSFGPRGTGGSMGNVEVHQVIAPARDGGLWSAWSRRPQFTLWNSSGAQTASFTRRLPWYTGEEESTLGWSTKPPTPRTAAIAQDQEGLVWFFIHVPAPTWKDAWATRPIRVGGGSEYVIKDIGFDRLFRTYVEVIDPAQIRVITSHTIDGYVHSTLPGGRVALYTIDGNGIPRVTIAQLSLNRPR
jgi:hypothetical protein